MAPLIMIWIAASAIICAAVIGVGLFAVAFIILATVNAVAEMWRAFRRP